LQLIYIRKVEDKVILRIVDACEKLEGAYSFSLFNIEGAYSIVFATETKRTKIQG
jgi:hypothetical protein